MPASAIDEDKLLLLEDGHCLKDHALSACNRPELRAEAEGDHVLALHVGDQTVTKVFSVGGPPRKVAIKRTKSWEALLYPGEPVLAASAPVHTIALAHPERDLGWLPGGELGILAIFFGLSLATGFALKSRFGVTL